MKWKFILMLRMINEINQAFWEKCQKNKQLPEIVIINTHNMNRTSTPTNLEL